MVSVYDEIGDTTRRQILFTLKSGAKTVTEIVTTTGLKQPNVSNHLARMRNRGVVIANKVGRLVYYKLASPEIESVVFALFAEKPAIHSSTDLAQLVQPFIEAATQGDETSAASIIDSALNARASLLDIYEFILEASMKEVGRLYGAGKVDIAQEHLASEVTLRMLARMIQIAGPTRKHGLNCILGCAPNAYHTIALRMAADYLRLSGWRTLFLGANVPIRSYLTAVYNNRPDLALISCVADESAPSSMQLVTELYKFRTPDRYFQIGIGGDAVAKSREQFLEAGADFVTGDLRSFAQEIAKRFSSHHFQSAWTSP